MEIINTPLKPITYMRREKKNSEELGMVVPDLNEALCELNNGKESPLDNTQTPQELSSFPILTTGLTPEESSNPIFPVFSVYTDKENEESNNLSNPKKRGNDSELEKTPAKKPKKKKKKKIHRPKVVGTSKLRRTPSKGTPLKPHTPKPITPKRVSGTKNVVKNKKNIKNKITSECDKEKVDETSAEAVNDASVSRRKFLDFDKEEKIEESLAIVNISKGQRSLKPEIIQCNKMPSTIFHLFFKTKGKRSKQRRRQYRKSFRRKEAKHKQITIETKNELELEPFPLFNCDFNKESGRSILEDNLWKDFKEKFRTIPPTVMALSDNLEFQTSLSEVTSLLTHFSSSVTPNIRGDNDTNNTQNIAEMSPSPQSEILDGTFEATSSMISQFLPSPNSCCSMGNMHQHHYNLPQNNAQYGDGPLVFNQGFMMENRGTNVFHYEHGGAIVPYTGLAPRKIEKESAIVLHSKNAFQGELTVVKKKKKQLLLELHAKGVNSWKLQLKNLSRLGEENERMWEDERRVFRERIGAFIAKLHLILGDRTFSEWKGSVIDSAVGVFLTQNVSDNLSSSAFMSLVARFSSSYESSSGNTTRGKILEGSQQLSDKIIANNEPGSLADETVQEQGVMLPTDENKIEMKKKKAVIDWEAMAKRYCKNLEGEKKEGDHNGTDWDELKKKYHVDGPRDSRRKDSVDWNVVRLAEPEDIAHAIEERGQHNIIALRIKEFLNRVLKLHGELDLEWLRHAPPLKVKEYLLEFHGLGLKSVECIRLLALQHVAFPVDTNVGRIAVRLGWVPLEPLPEEVQIHLLQELPVMDSIQKYLWPRLQTMDQQTLYQLHYHLITFGKVYCTKRNPNCNACPMRAECRHYASAYASARHALPRPEEKEKASSTSPTAAANSTLGLSLGLNLTLPSPPLVLETNQFSKSDQICKPIIEEPASPEPASPEPEPPQIEELIDIEDYFFYNEEDNDDDNDDDYDYDDDDIPTLNLCNEISQDPLYNYMDMNKIIYGDKEESRALVVLPHEFTNYSVPKLKSTSRLRTKHLVYELPDSHPLLVGLDKRDNNDPTPYLLAIWTPDEIVNSSQPSTSNTNSQQGNVETIPGSILIPCRTATKGCFPLNGTYFQTNEVFADHESSEYPIDVPRSWLWNLRRRLVYFGTSTNTIFRGLTTEEIQHCFWRGSLCVRAFERKTGYPKALAPRFHVSTAHAAKEKIKTKAKKAKTKTKTKTMDGQ
ncbi:protein ROS1A isoform X2 [Cannabis sativa]|uniref:protein ROS1A isoform X2 n=1 Tax=Cannabis sativa TaxID=3483 RepID=UPI0029CA22F2|nr:protein ROS1A isoform X2 [Cannabis sativa]